MLIGLGCVEGWRHLHGIIAEYLQEVPIDVMRHLFILQTYLLTIYIPPFYHSLNHQRLANGEIIVKQGSLDPILYFVNSGSVALFFQEYGKDILVKITRPGEILGASTFFEASVWTINARSLGAEVSSLTLDRLGKLLPDFPGLESKLNDFSIKFEISRESFRKINRDRRMYERVRIPGIVKMVLFDREGKNTGIGAKGDFFDISAGGASFHLCISSKKNARLLFGRNVGLWMVTSASASQFNMTGMVLAVRSQPVVGNEYSVSVRFSRTLTQKELNSLIISVRKR